MQVQVVGLKNFETTVREKFGGHLRGQIEETLPGDKDPVRSRKNLSLT